MAGSIETINIAATLLPIAGSNPAGVDLRADVSPTSLYYQIKDARNLARTAERQQMQGTVNQAPDEGWQKVFVLASDILATKSKDLEICAWYIEALLRKFGFAGLRDGFKLARELCEKYWDQLYPLVEGDDLSSKLFPFTGLNGDDSDGALIMPITNVLLTQGKTVGPFAQWHYKQALEISHVTNVDKQAKRISSGGVALKDIQLAVTETAPEFFRILYADLQAARSEFDQLTHCLDEKCGADSPPSSKIRATLSECLDSVKFLAGPALTTALQASDNVNLDGAEQVGSADQLQPTNIMTRDKAFDVLESISSYFKEAEPHSPVSYLIQKAIRWGRLPLPELWEELIRDDTMRKQLFTISGIEISNAVK